MLYSAWEIDGMKYLLLYLRLQGILLLFQITVSPVLNAVIVKGPPTIFPQRLFLPSHLTKLLSSLLRKIRTGVRKRNTNAIPNEVKSDTFWVYNFANFYSFFCNELRPTKSFQGGDEPGFLQFLIFLIYNKSNWSLSGYDSQPMQVKKIFEFKPYDGVGTGETACPANSKTAKCREQRRRTSTRKSGMFGN